MFGNILISMKQTETIEAWVARDRNGELYYFHEKPLRAIDMGFFMDRNCGDSNEMPSHLFPSIAFGNSPKKVKVTIELEEEK